MHDLDLAELLDGLPRQDLLILLNEFEIFFNISDRPISTWSSWFLWRIRRALGDYYPQPQGELIDVMDTVERKAIEEDMLTLAEKHRDKDGLVSFAVGLVAQLAFRALQDEQERQDLRDWLDKYRRQHPHGTPPRGSRRMPDQSITSDDRP